MFLISLNGCTIDYKLSINGKTFKENLKIIETDVSKFDLKEEDSLSVRELFTKEVKGDIYSAREGKSKLIDNDHELGIIYKNKTNDYISASSINYCYSEPIFTRKNKDVTIDTGEDFLCYDLYENIESIRIIIKTNNKVISSNAHEINGNNYIWNITENGSKRIMLSYEERDFNLIYSIIIITVVILIAIITISTLKKLRIKNNSI